MRQVLTYHQIGQLLSGEFTERSPECNSEESREEDSRDSETRSPLVSDVTVP